MISREPRTFADLKTARFQHAQVRCSFCKADHRPGWKYSTRHYVCSVCIEPKAARGDVLPRVARHERLQAKLDAIRVAEAGAP